LVSPKRIATATDENIGVLIAGSVDKPLVIDFWAEWCGPCKMMEEPFENMAEAHSEVTFAKYNTDENPGASHTFNVMGIPTFIIFQNGEEVGRIVGALPEGKFWEAIVETLGK